MHHRVQGSYRAVSYTHLDVYKRQVCDPGGGLVEYPCQNRNAAGVANALIAAELSLSGIHQLIPFDQMLDAMYAVGKRLPAELRETALGGCAATPAACAACGLCSGN